MIFNLKVKPHPHEDVRNISTSGNKIYFILKSSGDIKYIPDCSVFISFGSTATFDALLQKS